MFCKFCTKECKNKNSLCQHELRCPQNPDRKTNAGLKWTEEQKENFSNKCIDTKCNRSDWTDKRRQTASTNSKAINANYWTAERRAEHSERMKQIVVDNPDSYAKNNISGRVKMYEVNSTYGLTKVKGTWELKVANWLNENNIKWTNDIVPYSYFWNNGWHLYFPDFLLIDYNIILEVKGYETERDLLKWKAVTDKQFIVITKHNLDKLNETIVLNMASNANGEQEVS